MKKFIFSIFILPLFSWALLANAQTFDPNFTSPMMVADPTPIPAPAPSPVPSPTPAPSPASQIQFTFAGTPTVNVSTNGLSIHWSTNEDSKGYVDCGLSPGHYDRWHAEGSSPGITTHSATVPLPPVDQTVYCKITATSVPEGELAVAFLEITAKQIATVRGVSEPPTTPDPVKKPPTVVPKNVHNETVEQNKKHFTLKFEVEGDKQILTSRTVYIKLRVIMDPVAVVSVTAPQFTYQLSEFADFAGATWQPIVGPVTWTFTGDEKTRVLYAKVTNGQEESAVVSDTFYIAEDEAANLKRLGAVAGATALAFLATINWAGLLDSLKDLKEVQAENKTVDKS